MIRLLHILVLLLLLATPAAAQDFEKGVEAYKCGAHKEALREWRPLAEQGDALAQQALGVLYYKGQGVPQNYAKAEKWFRKSAEQGITGAQYNLGLMYDDGLGSTQDNEATEQGRFGIQRHLHTIAGLPQYQCKGQKINSFDYPTTRDGVWRNYSNAMKWYKKAAEQGHARAQYNLGVLYDQGNGVPQHYGEAMKWYRKAAEQGNTNAQYNLGVMYREGHGVTKDTVQAHKWFNIAAAQGHTDAEKARQKVAEDMTPQEVIKAQELAREWMNKHGERSAYDTSTSVSASLSPQ